MCIHNIPRKHSDFVTMMLNTASCLSYVFVILTTLFHYVSSLGNFQCVCYWMVKTPTGFVNMHLWWLSVYFRNILEKQCIMLGWYKSPGWMSAKWLLILVYLPLSIFTGKGRLKYNIRGNSEILVTVWSGGSYWAGYNSKWAPQRFADEWLMDGLRFFIDEGDTW